MSLDDQADGDTDESCLAEERRLRSIILVDSDKEDPEGEAIDFLSALGLSFVIRPEALQNRCGITNYETEEESTVLQMPHGPPEF